MPDDHCVEDLRRWSSHAPVKGFSDSAKLLSKVAAHIVSGKLDAKLAADVLAYRDAVDRKTPSSFGDMLARTGEALKPRDTAER